VFLGGFFGEIFYGLGFEISFGGASIGIWEVGIWEVEFCGEGKKDVCPDALSGIIFIAS
jgi:hypothetical protein